MIQIDLFHARELLDFFDKHAVDVTDEQRETRDKLEWAINNAHKLQLMFFGKIDRTAINEVEHLVLTLRAIWYTPEGNYAPHTVH